MTDWYSFAFGRPSPGRQSRRQAFRYATNEPRADVERASSLPGAIDTEAEDSAATGARSRGARGRYEGRTGRAVVPYVVGPGGVTGEPEPSSLSDVIASDPYNGDFVAREDADRRARLPSYLRQGSDEIVDEPIGHEPRNPNNRIADAPGARRQVDPTSEWIAAEERADVRWREGRPTPADTFIAMIYGRRRVEEVARENADMQDEITGRRPRR